MQVTRERWKACEIIKRTYSNIGNRVASVAIPRGGVWRVVAGGAGWRWGARWSASACLPPPPLCSALRSSRRTRPHVSLPGASEPGTQVTRSICDLAFTLHYTKTQWKASSTSLSSSGTSVLSTRNSTPSVRGLIQKWRRWKMKCLASEMNWWTGSLLSSSAPCLLPGNDICFCVLPGSLASLATRRIELTCFTERDRAWRNAGQCSLFS